MADRDAAEEARRPQEHAPTGYLHAGYAASLAEFGTPRCLPRSGGWILTRPVPGAEYIDGIGAYPILACRSWKSLAEDLEELSSDLISLSAVPDPFGRYDLDDLRRSFPDVCVPFKEHFVIDLSKTPADRVSPHHRKEARRALRKVTVEEHPEPTAFLDEWLRLHGNLVERHQIRGIKAFSRESFKQQLALPGAKLLRAIYEGTTVGAQLWLAHDQVAYGHVLAFDETGYRVGATYALYWFAIEQLAKYVDWLSLGGVAGVADEAGQGLAWFKRGWTQETRTAYFCGRVFDREGYSRLVEKVGAKGTSYFPAYRAGEMA